MANKTVPVKTYVTEAVFESLLAKAEAEDISVAQVVRKALHEYLAPKQVARV